MKSGWKVKIYGYYSWTVAVCLPETRAAKKKKQTNAGNAKYSKHNVYPNGYLVQFYWFKKIFKHNFHAIRHVQNFLYFWVKKKKKIQFTVLTLNGG